MKEYLATTPFDLYELHLFQLVAEQESFTKAAQIAGITQSAITRQIQGMEINLGVDLFERTTRSVRLTSAGSYLFRESKRFTHDADKLMQKLREEFAGVKKQIGFGVSQTIGLAYLPGFFHAALSRLPQIACEVSHQPSQGILTALEENRLDVGVVCPPKNLPRTLRATHEFDDTFNLIAPSATASDISLMEMNCADRRGWLARQRWLLITDTSQTGKLLRLWMLKQGWQFDPAMQLDNFDLIINLVALGLGVSFVPIRSLALYHHKRSVRRVALPERFVRKLAVVVRRNRKLPEHLQQFIESILF